jgi:neutral ceramidase
MKKASIISGSVLLFLAVLFIIATSPIDHTPYYESEYYTKSISRLDSLEKNLITDHGPIQAGFSRVSITPVLGSDEDDHTRGEFTELPLAGYGDRKGKPATGVNDSIYVSAVALKTNSQTIYLVSLDLLILPHNILDAVMVTLNSRGIDRDQLFFSATHTHSSLGGWGPGFIGKQFAGKENKNVQVWLGDKIAEAVIKAGSDLQPAMIGSGSFKAGEFTRNRLIGESGTKNDDFSFLVFEQTGKKKAVIGSFSAHTTTLGGSNMKISSDYPGYWRQMVENGSFDYAMFFAGAMGSQSPVGEGSGFDRTKFIGEALAQRMNALIPEVVMHPYAEISHLSLKMELPDYRTRITKNLTLSSRVNKKLMPVPENNYLQAIRINDMVWITTPADFSGEYALQIKNYLAAKGYDANVTGFNGSYVGYVIPGRYYFIDGYEPKAMGWFGPNMGEYTIDLMRRISNIVISSGNETAGLN